MSQTPDPASTVSNRFATLRGQQVLTVGIMYFGYAMFMVLRMVPTVTGTAMREDPALDIDLGDWGRILAMGTAGAVVGKFIGGYAADKFGGKLTFTVGLLISGVFVGLFAVSSSVLLFQLTFSAALMAKSAGWPAMAKIITHWFSPLEYGRVWGVISTSSRVGTLVATLGLGALLAFMSWRGVLLIAAAASLIAVVAFAFLLTERPHEQQFSSDDSDDVEAADVPVHPLDGTTLPQALTRIFASPQFWWITGSLAGLTILWDFLLFVPLYLQDTLGLTSANAAMSASAFPFGSLISVLIGGYVFDKLSRSATAWLMGGLLTIATSCIGTFLLMPHFGMTTVSLTYLALALLFIFGMCVSPCYYIPMSVFSIEFGGPHAGFLIALLDALAFAANAVFYYYAGEVAEASWGLFLTVLLAVSAWSLITTFVFLRGEARRRAGDIAVPGA
ncbi:Regulatory protein UhpC [Symmachiella macrocystis]|uniref:Regulatory protein UhpC n=1 Tax=Symmachiella macrocystis TaxID=2527985 RepID=A0A5C6BLU6_9PLAN|nr:MFS transporter [Symmachiella macrocystis]TWU13153.1 Regulatory protein UhpC [Symmachiella macrocystis]